MEKSTVDKKKKFTFANVMKSIWALPDARFFAMCDMFGTDTVFNELEYNPLWQSGHLFKSAHKAPKGKNGKNSENLEKFASNFDTKSQAEMENKEIFNGSRYDNLPPGDREFVNEFGKKLEKARDAYVEHVGDPKDNKVEYLSYMQCAANALLQHPTIKTLAKNLVAKSDVVVNGHRHWQYNGGLTGTDIPVPGMEDFHYHMMEGGHGVTLAAYSEEDHVHEEMGGGLTGYMVWPEYDHGCPVACSEKTNELLKQADEMKIGVMKLDAPRQIVIGALYIPFDDKNPETIDTHGHACTREEIQDAQIEFMRKMQLGNVDLQHNFEKGYGFVVESYIAKDGDPDFIPGTWVVGVKVTDDTVWEQVVKGEITGFSLAGSAYLREVA